MLGLGRLHLHAADQETARDLAAAAAEGKRSRLALLRADAGQLLACALFFMREELPAAFAPHLRGRGRSGRGGRSGSCRHPPRHEGRPGGDGRAPLSGRATLRPLANGRPDCPASRSRPRQGFTGR